MQPFALSQWLLALACVSHHQQQPSCTQIEALHPSGAASLPMLFKFAVARDEAAATGLLVEASCQDLPPLAQLLQCLMIHFQYPTPWQFGHLAADCLFGVQKHQLLSRIAAQLPHIRTPFVGKFDGLSSLLFPHAFQDMQKLGHHMMPQI